MYCVPLDRPVNLRMEESQLALLDDFASEAGVGRSEMLRRLLLMAMVRNKRARKSGDDPLGLTTGPTWDVVVMDRAVLEHFKSRLAAADDLRNALGGSSGEEAGILASRLVWIGTALRKFIETTEPEEGATQ